MITTPCVLLQISPRHMVRTVSPEGIAPLTNGPAGGVKIRGDEIASGEIPSFSRFSVLPARWASPAPDPADDAPPASQRLSVLNRAACGRATRGD